MHVTANDTMQRGYSYELTEPVGSEFDDRFEPELTPRETLGPGVDASKPLSYWQEKGSIHPDDPRGWFQRYCRYFMGRRPEDDSRQIERWRNMRRHVSRLKRNCMRGDLRCRPRQRQALLHWA